MEKEDRVFCSGPSKFSLKHWPPETRLEREKEVGVK